jgi:hypothetical protein
LPVSLLLPHLPFTHSPFPLNFLNLMKIPTAQIYQLKIQLEDTDPPLWRRILVPGDINLGQLHKVIQAAMGWTNMHMHEFLIDGEGYSDPEAELEDLRNELRYRLSQVAPPTRRSFHYMYDFGDGWEHKIVVEKIAGMDKRYPGHPICLAGARACPPEDSGGPGGYEEFLEAIANLKHQRHNEMLDWNGGDGDLQLFDPELFDLDEINDILKESR